MTEALTLGEPDPQAVFCRRFGDEWPEYTSLAEIRVEMDLIEPAFIGAVAIQRAAMGRMANLKNELAWDAFVDQHLSNIDRIHAMAEPINSGLDGFEELATDMYRAMVEPGESIRYDFRRIPEVEARIVSLLAERCRLVRQAAFFKRDLDESTAPARQARNIANAVRIAAGYTDRIPNFEILIEGMYEQLVPMSVDLQHRFWRQTTRQRDPRQARRITELMRRGETEIWNFGEFDNRIPVAS